MRKSFFLSLFIVSGLAPVFSQSAATLKTFTLPDATSDSDFSLDEYAQAQAVVVIFTSLYCPYAKLYEDRIAQLIKEYQDNNVRFVLVNPNNPRSSEADSRENMASWIKNQPYQVPYLSDERQKVANLLGAQKTPEAFVLLRQGDTFKPVYHGSIDDNPQVAKDAHHFHLRSAIDAVLQNKANTVTPVPATGCMIKR